MLRNITRIDPAKATLFVCDLQERFRSVIHCFPTIVNRTNLVARTSQQLNIPILVTEHVSRIFGKTVPEIDVGSNAQVFEKSLFSMVTPEFKAAFEAHNRKQVILCGIESHVCLLQTGLDLLPDHDVFIVCDAVSSQRPYDRAVALSQLQNSGAILTTAENIVFQLMGNATHPKFKTISGFVKESNSQMNEFAQDTSV